MRSRWILSLMGAALALSSTVGRADDHYKNCPPGQIVPGYPYPAPQPLPPSQGGTITPTPTPGGGTPTPTPTPGGGMTPAPIPGGGGDAPVDSGLSSAGGDFAQAPTGGTAGGGDSFNPGLIGDLGLSTFAIARVVGSPTTPAAFRVTPAVVQAVSGMYKITENESPRPTDRFYVGYNYYNNIATGLPGDGFDAHVQTIGFEKTFLGGNASIGVRVPFVQLDGGPGSDGIGDISVILKYAFLNDCRTGDVVSGGLVVTAPTGRRDFVNARGEEVHPTLFQPYLGFILNMDRLFVQGFSACVIPDDDRFPLFLTNDIGVGYRAMENAGSFLRYVIPTVEAHLTTPLRNKGFGLDILNYDGNLVMPHILVMTGGVHLGIGDRARLTFAIGTPVTGPRVFDYEAVCQFNWPF